MALDDRTVAIFKRLVAGIGQPDERDFARALLAVDEALSSLASKVETLEAATQDSTGTPTRGRQPVEAP